MTMTGRFIDHCICTLAAAALLAVMFSPIRVTIASHTIPPLALSRNFVTLKVGHSGQFAMSSRPSLEEADTIPSKIDDVLYAAAADGKDELAVTSPLTSVSFDILPSTCPQPYSKLVRVAAALTVRPLRC